MAPHLASAWSLYKDIKIHSVYYTHLLHIHMHMHTHTCTHAHKHTHTHYMHYW